LHPTNATVLILGESGTGKELVAREIHKASSRQDGPMVRVNCAAVPRDLFESEFFGHIKGAFTGALRDRVGRFELASGGTLFLDEVSEIPIELQSKLLRAIQEGEYERLWGNRTLKTDVRLVAASNRNLIEDVRKGRFREDLYYRLERLSDNAGAVTGPQIRHSPASPAHFVERACKEFNKAVCMITPQALTALKAYDWPGNVRELQNVIERSVITSRHGGEISFQLPNVTTLQESASHRDVSVTLRTEEELREAERSNILATLNKTRWKIYGSGGAAELLGIKPGRFRRA
jgi:transcriptional regulator with GAF, ATPase, and Fis domain